MLRIPKDPFIVVDGSSYLFRAYHALPPLTTASGQPTGAIVGVINMIRKLINEYQPTRMAVVFDSKEKNFRHEAYAAYKANRLVMPDELQQQIEPLHQIIRAMGLPLIMMPGIEADDIIGTLALQAKKAGVFTLISTGDKDFTQLVEENIWLINTMSGDIYDREKVIEKFELPPESMIDYLTLIGDSVDNIPGVPKVGPKTAVKWLKTYGSLAGIIENSGEITGKVGENLRDTLSMLPLFRQLITIQLDVAVPNHFSELCLTVPETQNLVVLYQQLEFKNWLKMLEHQVVISTKNEARYETILTEAQFSAWLMRLQAASLFSFDTETTSLNHMEAEIVGVSFAITPGEAAYVPVAHDYSGAPLQLDRDWVLAQLKPILESSTILKIGHHLKYDAAVLENYQIKLAGIAFDTMLESYVLDSTASRHDMDTLAKKHLHYQTVSFEDVAGKGVKQLTFNQVLLEKAAFYAAEDADVVLKLHQVFWPLLEQSAQQKYIFEAIEMPLVPILTEMERYGVLVDANRLGEISQELTERLTTLEVDIYLMAGQEFNINSPKQLQEILFEKLNLPILEKTPTGQPSTAESVLQELAHQYPLPNMILEYRSLSKLKSTYTDKLPLQINPKTHRVHTSYHQAVTATGRLSSSDPNLQNIPIRRLEGKKIRSAFIAPKGYKILAADYSQIELRIMAHLTQDPGLLKAFQENQDVHQSTAAAVFNVALETVTEEQRRRAKAINFGLMYGMSAFGLAKQLGISREEAVAYVEQYFNAFPKVRAFMEKIRLEASEKGFVETMLGRRLYLPDIKSNNAMMRKAAERAAINAPMQGTNADIIKLSMIKLHEWIIKNDLDIHMTMQVHDELVFEVADDIVHQVKEDIRNIMENIIPLSVPLQVGIGIGDNWDEAH